MEMVTGSGGGLPLAALILVAALALAFVAYCWFDLSRARVRARYLPKWA